MKPDSIALALLLDLFKGLPYSPEDSQDFKRDFDRVTNYLGTNYLGYLDKYSLIQYTIRTQPPDGIYAIFLKHKSLEVYVQVNNGIYEIDFKQGNFESSKICDRKEDMLELCRAFIPYILSGGVYIDDIVRATTLFPEAASYIFSGEAHAEKT